MSSTSSPKKDRKIYQYFSQPAAKRFKDDNSDDGEAGSDAGGDWENGQPELPDFEGELVPISYLQQHIQPMIEYMKKNKKSTSSAKHFKKSATEYFAHKGIEDPGKWAKCLDHYLRIALRSTNLSIGHCCNILQHYLQKGETVREYPDWPKPPLNFQRTYAKNNGIKLGFGSGFSELTAAINGDADGRAEAEAEVVEANQRYVQEVKEFRELHDNLSDEQLQFIQKTIAKYEKLGRLQQKAPKGTPIKKKPAARVPFFETPYEAFCHAYRDQYTDLEPEKRTKKLTKKFKKLSDTELEVYQRLAE
ncbi:unnamed protein product, partial [Mesorhabditis spiculigera]